MNVRHCLANGILSRTVLVPLGLALPIVLMTISTPLAADIPARPVAKSPVAAPVTNWTGCYVDAGGGYGMWNQEVTYSFDPTLGPGTDISLTTTSGGRGWFGTVGGGCDLQLGERWVVGAFGSYDFSGVKGHMQIPFADLSGEEKLRSSWAAGGRIGWLATPAILTYLSGGYTQARFSAVSLFNVVTFAQSIYHLQATTYSGWFVGGGTEIMLTPGWFVRGEYRYARYDDEFVPMIITATGARSGAGIDSEKFVQTIRTELVWKWNWGSR